MIGWNVVCPCGSLAREVDDIRWRGASVSTDAEVSHVLIVRERTDPGPKSVVEFLYLDLCSTVSLLEAGPRERETMSGKDSLIVISLPC